MGIKTDISPGPDSVPVPAETVVVARDMDRFSREGPASGYSSERLIPIRREGVIERLSIRYEMEAPAQVLVRQGDRVTASQALATFSQSKNRYVVDVAQALGVGFDRDGPGDDQSAGGCGGERRGHCNGHRYFAMVPQVVPGAGVRRSVECYSRLGGNRPGANCGRRGDTGGLCRVEWCLPAKAAASYLRLRRRYLMWLGWWGARSPALCGRYAGQEVKP